MLSLLSLAAHRLRRGDPYPAAPAPRSTPGRTSAEIRAADAGRSSRRVPAIFSRRPLRAHTCPLRAAYRQTRGDPGRAGRRRARRQDARLQRSGQLTPGDLRAGCRLFAPGGRCELDTGMLRAARGRRGGDPCPAAPAPRSTPGRPSAGIRAADAG